MFLREKRFIVFNPNCSLKFFTKYNRVNVPALFFLILEHTQGHQEPRSRGKEKEETRGD